MTDRRTDRRIHDNSIYCASIASRSKMAQITQINRSDIKRDSVADDKAYYNYEVLQNEIVVVTDEILLQT